MSVCTEYGCFRLDTKFHSQTYYAGPSANVSDLLDSLLHGYDKRLRPEYKSENDPALKGTSTAAAVRTTPQCRAC